MNIPEKSSELNQSSSHPKNWDLVPDSGLAYARVSSKESDPVNGLASGPGSGLASGSASGPASGPTSGPASGPGSGPASGSASGPASGLQPIPATVAVSTQAARSSAPIARVSARQPVDSEVIEYIGEEFHGTASQSFHSYNNDDTSRRDATGDEDAEYAQDADDSDEQGMPGRIPEASHQRIKDGFDEV